jgi:hypothetical protein
MQDNKEECDTRVRSETETAERCRANMAKTDAKLSEVTVIALDLKEERASLEERLAQTTETAAQAAADLVQVRERDRVVHT